MFQRFLQVLLFILFLSWWADALHAQSFFDHFFSHGDFFSSGSLGMEKNVDLKWAEDAKNHILTITPRGDDDIPLDISIKDGFVMVSGKVLKEKVVNRHGSSMRSSYLSQISLSEAIPPGADANKGKIRQEGKSIKITFPKTRDSSRSSGGDQRQENKNLQDIQIFGDKI